MTPEELGGLNEKLADIQKALEALNDAAPVDVTPKGVIGKDGAAAQAAVDENEVRLAQMELRRKFVAMPRTELLDMLSIQAERRTGKQADASVLNFLASRNDMVQKALDTTGGTALIRQDLEPMLYALFVKRFPMWERIRKEPANGVVHAYNQITSYGGAVYQTETGTVTDDTSVYARQTSNIAVLATRRGVTLKEQFAVAQGGAPYNPLGVELSNGVTAMVATIQNTIFQGNASDPTGTATTESGAYNQYAHDGLRKLLGTTGAGSPVIVEKGNSSYVAALNLAAATVMNNGGSPSAIVMSPLRYAAWTSELLATVRQSPGGAGAQGLNFGSVMTAAGELPILTVPGPFIGTYAISGVNKEDIYILDEDTVSVPWLGSDSITTLEIPVGVNGSLNRLYIMFFLNGLAVKAPLFNAKVRVNI